MKLIKTLLFLIILLTSCASSLTRLPTLKNRTLRIAEDFTGFYYQYTVCNRRLLVLSKCYLKQEFYDFKNKETRLKLKHMGFKLKVIKDI